MLYKNNKHLQVIKVVTKKDREKIIMPDFALFKDKLAKKRIKNPYMTDENVLDKHKKDYKTTPIVKSQKISFCTDNKRPKDFVKNKKTMNSIFNISGMTTFKKNNDSK